MFLYFPFEFNYKELISLHSNALDQLIQAIFEILAYCTGCWENTHGNDPTLLKYGCVRQTSGSVTAVR